MIIKKITRGTAIAALSLMFSIVAIAQNSPELSDAEVAHVAVTANQIDINYARLAKEKSKDKEVINFAETMARDHKAVIGQAATLAEKLGVTLKDNAVSKKLLADAEATKNKLNAMSAKEFNKAYIDNEVAYHRAVISAVNDLLIPETENAELKELLKNVVPALEAHLEHALMVQKGYTH